MSGGSDRAIRLWALKERKLTATLDELSSHTKILGTKFIPELPWAIGHVYCVAFAPHGLVISAGGTSYSSRLLGELIFWNTASSSK